MPEDMLDRTPDRMSERMPEDMPDKSAERGYIVEYQKCRLAKMILHVHERGCEVRALIS